MTIKTLDAEGDDDYDIDEIDVVPTYESDPRATIENFTGTPVEYLMRVGYSVAKRYLLSKEDSEDVVQEAFERVILAARSRKSVPKNGRAYFARIVLNLIIDMWKKQLAAKRGGGAVVLGLDEKIQVEDLAPTPSDSAENIELRRCVLAAIDTLSPANREVLELALDIDSGNFDRMSHAEIAERLGLPTKTVKSRMHETKKKLAICLADWKEER